MNKQETIKKLNEIKEGLNESIPQFTYEEAYNEIYDTVRDYEGAEDLERIFLDFGFANTDEAEELAHIRLVDGGLASLVCFLAGVQYLSDDLYILDGYQNLQNVKNSDFTDLTNLLLDALKD